jgi:hypothetical protein
MDHERGHSSFAGMPLIARIADLISDLLLRHVQAHRASSKVCTKRCESKEADGRLHPARRDAGNLLRQAHDRVLSGRLLHAADRLRVYTVYEANVTDPEGCAARDFSHHEGRHLGFYFCCVARNALAWTSSGSPGSAVFHIDKNS